MDVVAPAAHRHSQTLSIGFPEKYAFSLPHYVRRNVQDGMGVIHPELGFYVNRYGGLHCQSDKTEPFFT